MSKTDSFSEGHYACEVSTEGPEFSTVRAERQMKVYGKLIQYTIHQFSVIKSSALGLIRVHSN